LAGLEQVTTLRLEGTSVRGHGFRRWESPSIEGIHLVGAGSDRLDLDALARFRKLKTLWVTGEPSRVDGLRSLGGLRFLHWVHLPLTGLR
jgi:hypothetical protein